MENFLKLEMLLLRNLVIIKAAIISCTCDDGIGPYRLVDCCQPSGGTVTVHFASLFGAVDSRVANAYSSGTVNCGTTVLQTEYFHSG